MRIMAVLLCVGVWMISCEEFGRVEMRVGRMFGVEAFPEPRTPSYKLTSGGDEPTNYR